MMNTFIETFSVWQFFKTGDYECVRRGVSAEEAIKALDHYTDNVAVKMGFIEKVIITDSGDRIVLEWRHDKGRVWPNEDKCLRCKTNPRVLGEPLCEECANGE
jgi:hypothetical protein